MFIFFSSFYKRKINENRKKKPQSLSSLSRDKTLWTTRPLRRIQRRSLTSSHLINFSPSWSSLETSTGPVLTATAEGLLRGLCWADFGALSGSVDVRAAAVAVVNADAAMLSDFLYSCSSQMNFISWYFATFFFCFSVVDWNSIETI